MQPVADAEAWLQQFNMICIASSNGNGNEGVAMLQACMMTMRQQDLLEDMNMRRGKKGGKWSKVGEAI